MMTRNHSIHVFTIWCKYTQIKASANTFFIRILISFAIAAVQMSNLDTRQEVETSEENEEEKMTSQMSMTLDLFLMRSPGLS